MNFENTHTQIAVISTLLLVFFLLWFFMKLQIPNMGNLNTHKNDRESFKPKWYGLKEGGQYGKLSIAADGLVRNPPSPPEEKPTFSEINNPVEVQNDTVYEVVSENIKQYKEVATQASPTSLYTSRFAQNSGHRARQPDNSPDDGLLSVPYNPYPDINYKVTYYGQKPDGEYGNLKLTASGLTATQLEAPKPLPPVSFKASNIAAAEKSDYALYPNTYKYNLVTLE
jgi:hypothetical protein